MKLFSDHYDRFVGADYDKIAGFIDGAVKKYKPGSSLVCDLGCGTASVTAKMSLLGYDPIGIDNDPDMLSVARDKLADSGITDVLLLCQDITEFELYGTVDVIFSTLDTLNYVTEPDKLDRLFALVKNYLEYDGLFIFDVNSGYKFKNVLSDNVFAYDGEDCFCCWHSHFDGDSGICTHGLTYFSLRSDGSYERSEETQKQRYYTIDEITSIAERYGFEVLSVSDGYSSKQVTESTERVAFILKINK